MPAKKEEKRHCPKCGEPTKETATCNVCGKVGCVERCNPNGKTAPCAACTSLGADESGPDDPDDEEDEEERGEEE
jgi:hypothetical protein